MSSRLSAASAACPLSAPLESNAKAVDGDALLRQTTAQWREQGGDLWVFAYASLIWRPDFEVAERRIARLYGWHRALRMWSRVNRGTRECPGLVFCLLAGGSCPGAALRVPAERAEAVLAQLWQREMPIPMYIPQWLNCRTDSGTVRALAFTLPHASPSHTGELGTQEYQRIFREARGRYGSTRDYAQDTAHGLRAVGIRDRVLERLIQEATAFDSDTNDAGAIRTED